MGRLGPLTSQALGRSPYDDVVQGTGEEDMRSPEQLYDERGRPVNPETRRINRDVIRSHNEVMLVIGVAEPENGAAVAEAQAEAIRQRNDFENLVGKRLFRIADVLETAGVWGVNGMRQRIMIYKQYAQIPFYDLFQFQRSQQSVSSYLFAGLPSFIVSTLLDYVPMRRVQKRDKNGATYQRYLGSQRWHSVLMLYVKLHLDIHTFMQRVGLISPMAIVPHWKFFVPGSSQSPIFAPSFPASITPGSILRWLGGCAMGAVPFLGYLFLTRASNFLTVYLCAGALHYLPHPRNPPKRKQAKEVSAPQSSTSSAPAAPHQTVASSSPGEEIRLEEPPRHGRDITRDDPTFRALEGQSQNEAIPVGAVRRQSTISVRGDEFASDDEEADLVSATLISFDVEATESTNTTPGVWSAELRPNLTDTRAAGSQEPLYRDTALFRLPPILAADAIGVTVARILMAPSESEVLLSLARLMMARNGPPPESFYELGFWQMSSFRRMLNVLGVELLFLFLQGEVWGAMTMGAEMCRYTDEEWTRAQGEDKDEEES